MAVGALSHPAATASAGSENDADKVKELVVALEDHTRTIVYFDDVVERMLDAIAEVKISQGSIVSLAKAELDLLGQIEIARDFMLEALTNQNDRTRLRETFGGDCTRIARVRAICESIVFSGMNKGDQRLPTCLRACESVEKVIVDLGDGEALREAQFDVRTAIEKSSGLAAWAIEVSASVGSSASNAKARQAISFSRRGSGSPPTRDYAERIVEVARALMRENAERQEQELREDVVRLEAKIREELVSCEQRLQQCLLNSESQLQEQMQRLPSSADLVRIRSHIDEGIKTLASQADIERLQLQVENNMNGFASRAALESLASQEAINQIQLQVESNLSTRATRADVDRVEDRISSLVSQEDLERVRLQIEDKMSDIDRAHQQLQDKFSALASQADVEQLRAHVVGEINACVYRSDLDSTRSQLEERIDGCASTADLNSTRKHIEDRLGSLALQAEVDRISLEFEGKIGDLASQTDLDMTRMQMLDEMNNLVSHVHFDSICEQIENKMATLASNANLEQTLLQVENQINSLSYVSHADLDVALEHVDKRLSAAASQTDFEIVRASVENNTYALASFAGLEQVNEQIKHQILVLETDLAQARDESGCQAICAENHLAQLEKGLELAGKRWDNHTADTQERIERLDKALVERHGKLSDDLKKDCHTLVIDETERLRNELHVKLGALEGLTKTSAPKKEVASIRATIENISLDLEKVKKAADLDPLWNSFAHVGSLVADLQKRLNDLEKSIEVDKGMHAGIFSMGG